MPNCFQLVRKSDPKAGPVVLQKVDEEMCAHFGVACDAKQWYMAWYDIIGFSVACGKTFAELRERYRTSDLAWDANLIPIVDWLDANFTTDAWAEVGRR